MRNTNTPSPPAIEETQQRSKFLSFVYLLLRCVFNLTVLIGICSLLVAYVVASAQHLWYPTQSFWHLLLTDLLDARVIGLDLILMFFILSQDY